MGSPAPFIGPIAIDGPAASGKTSVGERVADALRFEFLDTGLMYRAVTLAAMRAGVGSRDEPGATRLAESLPIVVRTRGQSRIILAGEDVTDLLHRADVDAQVSHYSAIPGVRAAMVAQQRALASNGRIVMAGRDIGSVVLPHAPVRVFLTASEDERQRRRGVQAHELGDGESAAERQHAVVERDRADSTRAVAPLRLADGAVEIDTTARTIDDVVEAVLRLVASCREVAR